MYAIYRILLESTQLNTVFHMHNKFVHIKQSVITYKYSHI